VDDLGARMSHVRDSGSRGNPVSGRCDRRLPSDHDPNLATRLGAEFGPLGVSTWPNISAPPTCGLPCRNRTPPSRDSLGGGIFSCVVVVVTGRAPRSAGPPRAPSSERSVRPRCARRTLHLWCSPVASLCVLAVARVGVVGRARKIQCPFTPLPRPNPRAIRLARPRFWSCGSILP
jgi:hypothetical protein